MLTIGSRRSRPAPSTLFYPAAAIYGAVVLPWSVLTMTGVIAGPAALSTPFGHAHEMLLGYALAVVAGNQLPALRTPLLLGLLALWLAARLSFLAVPDGWGLLPDFVFAIALAWNIAPRLLRAAKKLRNKALPVILVALCAGAVALDAARLDVGLEPLSAATLVVLLLAALMLFMGGRIIAAAAAGQLHRQGAAPGARVQPRTEAALMIAMAIAVAAAAFAAMEPAMRAACVGAGALALVRLARWRLWSCEERPDLLCLGAGYAWLAFGLIAIGTTPAAYRAVALHLVTVGALGTLTFNVMANATLARAHRSAAKERSVVWGTALIGVATALRSVAAVTPEPLVLLALAAACWSAALLTLCGLFVRALWPSAISSST